MAAPRRSPTVSHYTSLGCPPHVRPCEQDTARSESEALKRAEYEDDCAVLQPDRHGPLVHSSIRPGLISALPPAAGDLEWSSRGRCPSEGLVGRRLSGPAAAVWFANPQRTTRLIAGTP